MPGPQEQRTSYKGSPPRAWFRAQLIALDGAIKELELLADTGNPFGLIVSVPLLQQFKQLDSASVATNFGQLEAGWFQIRIPAIGLDHVLRGYGSDAVLAAAQASSADFQGLAGLPFLRLIEYGGDANDFWIRSKSASP